MFHCPYCKGNTRVLQNLLDKRLRKCLSCEAKFITVEIVEDKLESNN